MSDEPWQAETDHPWPAERRSGLMHWLRRRLRPLGGIADAVSHADTGPYAGAPRAPQLRVDNDRSYSTIRYAPGQVAYTTTATDRDECPTCGRPTAETHRIEYLRAADGGDDHTETPVGAVRTCANCHADSWLTRSQMPTATRARKAARNHVV